MNPNFRKIGPPPPPKRLRGGFLWADAFGALGGPMQPSFDAAMKTGDVVQKVKKESIAPPGVGRQERVQAYLEQTAGLEACVKTLAQKLAADKSLEWAKQDLKNDEEMVLGHATALSLINQKLPTSAPVVAIKAKASQLAKETAALINAGFIRNVKSMYGDFKMKAPAYDPLYVPKKSGRSGGKDMTVGYFDDPDLWALSWQAQTQGHTPGAEILRTARQELVAAAPKKPVHATTGIGESDLPEYDSKTGKWFLPVPKGYKTWAHYIYNTDYFNSSLTAGYDTHTMDPYGIPAKSRGAYKSCFSEKVGYTAWVNCVKTHNAARRAAVLQNIGKLRQLAKALDDLYRADPAWVYPGKVFVGAKSRAEIIDVLMARTAGPHAKDRQWWRAYKGGPVTPKGTPAYKYFVAQVAAAEKALQKATLMYQSARCNNLSDVEKKVMEAKAKMAANVLIAEQAAKRADHHMKDVMAMHKKLKDLAAYLYGGCAELDQLDPKDPATTAQKIANAVEFCSKHPKEGSPAYKLKVAKRNLKLAQAAYQECVGVFGASHPECKKAYNAVAEAKSVLGAAGMDAELIVQKRTDTRGERTEKRTGDGGVYDRAEESDAARTQAKNADGTVVTGKDKDGNDVSVTVTLSDRDKNKLAAVGEKNARTKASANKVGTFTKAWGDNLKHLILEFDLDVDPGQTDDNTKKACTAAEKHGGTCPDPVCPPGQRYSGTKCVPITPPQDAGFPWWIAVAVAAPFLLGG